MKPNGIDGSPNMVARTMTILATVAVSAFLAAMILRHYLPPDEPSLVHLILATGIMPLIMGAMIYFTPVLTHSRTAGWLVLMVPPLALIAGTLASTGLLWRRDLLPIPAVLAIVAASSLLGWMWYRARTMLGRPHPGLDWYRWALVCLLLGLMAILVAMFRPEYWMALRRFHLHINLLGFVGMTAFGTLCVLVPTVAGYSDPNARHRLRVDLYFAVTGTLLVASGPAWLTWLVWPGLVLWLIPLMRFASSLVMRWRKFVWGWHRSSTSLGVAVFGLIAVLVSAGFHAAGGRPSAVSMQLFFFVFLFPLVTGAVSYLLPVWLWPARNTAVYEFTARRLAWGSGARSLVFLAAGVVAYFGMREAIYLAGIGILVFLLQLVWTLWARFSSNI
jgi:hypothetical protein